MSRLGNFGGRLYRGDVSFEFVGRQRLWYVVSAAVLLIAILALLVRGLHLGIEFTGGSAFQFPARGASVTEVRSVVQTAAGADQVVVQELGNNQWRAQTEALTPEQVTQVQERLASEFGINPNDVSPQSIGPSWGEQISQKALIALAVFLGLVVLFLSMTFEWKMAVAAIAALVHDVAITIGVYALVGFEVSPASVIGLLTILGYSLYDTVVIFDKVRENTLGLLGGARMTYSQAANLALNQTLVRSINTSLTSLLPVSAILFVGAGLLGVGTLKDLALVLFIGMMAGTYSSIFIATPLLAGLKEREPQFQALARRVAARQSGGTGKAAAKSAKRRSASAEVPAEGYGKEGARKEEADVGEEDAAEAVGALSQQGRGGEYGPRQQPRRTTKSKRRPSGKKRR
ncbi:MAG: protein translocase subunit SecF [Streptosporangiales bacterium]|nr:protein translocase subunit SecF [Streptosporangiales bacterium]